MTTATFDDELRAAFDTWAPTYEDDATAKLIKRGYSYGELGAAIAEVIVAVPAAGPVLEVGTGTGVLGIEIARRIPDVELNGLDISPAMLARARDKAVYATLDLASADAYDYSRGYRSIFSAFVFHSIGDQAGFLDRVRAGLQPGARLVIVDLFPDSLPDTEAGVEHSRRFEKRAPSNYLEVQAFQRLATSAGFTILECKLMGEEREYAHVWHVLSLSAASRFGPD